MLIKRYSMDHGAKQGDILSPMLFNAISEITGVFVVLALLFATFVASGQIHAAQDASIYRNIDLLR